LIIGFLYYIDDDSIIISTKFKNFIFEKNKKKENEVEMSFINNHTIKDIKLISIENDVTLIKKNNSRPIKHCKNY